MSLNIVRFTTDGHPQWGLLQDSKVMTLNTSAQTTGELVSLGHSGIHGCLESHGAVYECKDVTLLSPITTPTNVLCQGANYRQHMIDSGMDPDAKKFNMFFTKSSTSVTGPRGSIIKPSHVELLDYEVELTLVIGKKTTGPVEVNNSNLHEFVAGICIGNDISARDIQIPQMQFHKGKSYRTFCPLGPVLCILDKDEMHYLEELRVLLTVNDEVRQKDTTNNLMFKPAETIQEYSQIHDFEPGDILMTGTPSGCALGLPSPALVKISGLLPEAKKWQLFIKSQKKRSQYLQVGDTVESTIVSTDGKIDLGKQTHAIASES
ncbi:fumarylacetoacetate hydrolase family protein [Alcanivorax sp.]|jgi:2-keto-4-pentenoate hydratase/2-oxohepta-3-ene-1,7-dioic acid hydratase in catechol pathway|uniref:fumarylacetoacetate hydrolase family protein n=1 Tax=Alcanivorax sp. TaxID=1872427 RepID=UPI0032D933E0